MLVKNAGILNFFKLFRQAFWGIKLQIMILAVLSFLNSLLEGIGMGTLVPFFSFILKDQMKGADTISRIFEKLFLYFHVTFNLRYLIIFVALIFLFKAVILFCINYISVNIISSYQQKTRSELFRLTLEADWPYLSRQKVGYLDQILTTDINNGSAILAYLSAIILITGKLLVYGFIAFHISTVVALLALILGLVFFLVFKRFFYKNRLVSGEAENVNKLLAHYVNESLIGIKTIKAASLELPVIRRGLVYFKKMKELNISLMIVRSITDLSLQPLGAFFIIVIFSLLYKSTDFNVAYFLLIIYAIAQIFIGIQATQQQLHGMITATPYLMRILRYKDELIRNKERDTGTEDFVFKDCLSFKAISFSYDGERGALQDINLIVKKGEMVGLIGPSGAGKTTIVDLLLRFLKPHRGNILIDSKDIINISIGDWRKNIGYVSQEVFLKNDTIENNIKFYDETVTYEDMVEAGRMANILNFVNSLPNKFKTEVGERGVMLSAGQRQRIALARVLCRKPQILILDEATSALDSESELLIQKAINELKGRITIMVIAHRLSTIKSADRLIVIDRGRIVEEGKPADLLENSGSYFYKIFHLK